MSASGVPRLIHLIFALDWAQCACVCGSREARCRVNQDFSAYTNASCQLKSPSLGKMELISFIELKVGCDAIKIGNCDATSLARNTKEPKLMWSVGREKMKFTWESDFQSSESIDSQIVIVCAFKTLYRCDVSCVGDNVLSAPCAGNRWRKKYLIGT